MSTPAEAVARLLDPSGIAIVGASDNRYYARSLIANLLAAGYPRERIYPVNPRYDEVCGLPCHARVGDIGRPVSLAVAATGAGTVPSIIREAGEGGVESLVVLADGYAEQDDAGRRRQAELTTLARESGVHLLGPNTLGFFAPDSGAAVWAPGELVRPLESGRIGVVFQSSGMLNLFVGLCITRRLGVRAAFSVGNEAGFSTADLIRHLAEDPGTSVVVAMVETTDRPKDLALALESARAAGKPVVMLKLGRSERARRNALAHTGRMASASSSWDALLSRLGVVVVDDLDELVECAALFADPPTAGRTSSRVALVTVSGGDCSLLSDMSEALEVPLATLREDTHARLVELLEKPSLLGNPLDVENLLRQDESRFYRVIDTLCSDPGVDVVAYRMYLPTAPTGPTTRMYGELVGRARSAGKRPVVLTRAIEDLDHAWYEVFRDLGAPLLPGYRPGLSSLARLSAWTNRAEPAAAPALDGVRDVPSTGGEPRVLTWGETQEVLALAGFPYAPARCVGTPDEAVAAADELGYPVAVKLASTEAPHKSDIGGVVLGVADEAGLRAAVEQVVVNAGRAGVSVDGLEVQAMSPKGVEMIVGVTVDAALGPLVVVGMGGVLTEITNDVVVMLPEPDPVDVRRHLDTLAGAPLLHGYRGQEPADIDALCGAVASLSRHLLEDPSSLTELDLNPVMVLPQGLGVVAVDAMAVGAAPAS